MGKQMNTAAEARTPPTLNPGGSNKDKDTNLHPKLEDMRLLEPKKKGNG